MKISAIAISGANGTGKTTLCSVLSDRLRWKHVNIGQEFRRITEGFKLDIKDFGSVPDDVLQKVDLIMEEKMDEEEHVIYDGRLSCYLARNRPNIFKILCKANLDVRVERTSTRDNITIEEAKKRIQAREVEEREVFKRLYNLENPFDLQCIDLVVDASEKNPEELVNEIFDAIEF